jgi:hypothetical protein
MGELAFHSIYTENNSIILNFVPTKAADFLAPAAGE